MCGIMDYFGWLDMSAAEQWTLGVTLISLILAAWGAVWTVTRWQKTRRLELQLLLLQTIPQVRKYWEAVLETEPGNPKRQTDAEKKIMDSKRKFYAAAYGYTSLAKLEGAVQVAVASAAYMDALIDIQGRTS